MVRFKRDKSIGYKRFIVKGTKSCGRTFSTVSRGIRTRVSLVLTVRLPGYSEKADGSKRAIQNATVAF